MAGVQIKGFDASIASIRRLKGMPDDATMVRIGNIARSAIQSNFPGNPLHWKPNAPSTVAAKGSSSPLIDDGLLKNSFFTRTGATGKKKFAEVFTRDFKAAIHQFGTRPYDIFPKFSTASFLKGKGRRFLRFKTDKGIVFSQHVRHPGVAARPFMVIRPEWKEKIRQILLAAVGGK